MTDPYEPPNSLSDENLRETSTASGNEPVVGCFFGGCLVPIILGLNGLMTAVILPFGIVSLGTLGMLAGYLWRWCWRR